MVRKLHQPPSPRERPRHGEHLPAMVDRMHLGGIEEDPALLVDHQGIVFVGVPEIEYQIDAEHRAAFLRAIQAVGPTRRRNGAASWRIYRDLGEEGRFVERYVVTSWSEYVRLRTRMTVSDRKLQDHVLELQKQGVPVRVARLLGVNEREFMESAR